MWKHWLLIGIVMTVLSCGNGSSPKETGDPAGLMPDAPDGWEQTGSTQTYTGFELSDYINGGAEAYLAYGFRRVVVREFTNADGARLTIDIYEMDSPENAYGVFSTDRAGKSWPIGADAAYGSGLLSFWKGPYFVSVMCYPAPPNVKDVIRELGVIIAEKITAESKRPEILRILPDSDVFSESVCYFHRQTSLNNIRFLFDENLLHLGDDVDALTWEQRVATSEESEGRLRQMVIQYPSEAAAEKAFGEFAAGFFGVTGDMSEKKPDSPLSIELDNGKFAASSLDASWIVLVLDAPSTAAASEAALATQLKLKELKSNEREESS